MENQKKLSQELQEFMMLNKIFTLNELLLIKEENLITMDGFGWRILKEILKLGQV